MFKRISIAIMNVSGMGASQFITAIQGGVEFRSTCYLGAGKRENGGRHGAWHLQERLATKAVERLIAPAVSMS